MITAVDPASGTISFVGPNQAVRTVSPKNSDVLRLTRNLKVGDQVDIVYEEALANPTGKPFRIRRSGRSRPETARGISSGNHMPGYRTVQCMVFSLERLAGLSTTTWHTTWVNEQF